MTPTRTPGITSTPTPIPRTFTPTPTANPANSATPTVTPNSLATATATPDPLATATATATPDPLATATATPNPDEEEIDRIIQRQSEGDPTDIWIWRTPTDEDKIHRHELKMFSVKHTTKLQPFIVYPDRVLPDDAAVRELEDSYPIPVYPTATGTPMPPFFADTSTDERRNRNMPGPTWIPATPTATAIGDF